MKLIEVIGFELKEEVLISLCWPCLVSIKSKASSWIPDHVLFFKTCWSYKYRLSEQRIGSVAAVSL
jgi:hypothetical protein